jgi:hypothetical protein
MAKTGDGMLNHILGHSLDAHENIGLDTRNVNTKTATPSATSIPSAPSGQKSDKTPKKSIGSTEERANEAITQV